MGFEKAQDAGPAPRGLRGLALAAGHQPRPVGVPSLHSSVSPRWPCLLPGDPKEGRPGSAASILAPHLPLPGGLPQSGRSTGRSVPEPEECEPCSSPPPGQPWNWAAGPGTPRAMLLGLQAVSDSRSWPHIVSLEPEAPLQGLQTSRSWSAVAPEPAAAGVGCPPRPTSSSPFTRNPVGPQWGPIRAPATCPPVHVRSLSAPGRAVQSIPSAA